MDSSTSRRDSRICMVSLRGLNHQAAWCSNYEFEDVICAVDDVDLLTLGRGWANSLREWTVKRLIWRPGLHQLAHRLNPGVNSVALEKDYEAFVFICMNPSDLLYLNGVAGWKERCKVKICFIAEFYAGWLEEYRFHLRLLEHFDHVFFCFSGTVQTVEDFVGRPCHHVPLAADVLRFTPYPDPPLRSIDVYSMGRRADAMHQILLGMAQREGLFYIYDTIPGLLIQPRDHRAHRDLVANVAKRSRYFVTFPAKVDCADETRGQSEVGARFFEGAAAGSVMIGRSPSSPAFCELFDWPDAVVETQPDGSDVAKVLSKFDAEPERLQEISRRNAHQALIRHDWAHRWKQILDIVRLQPLPALEMRERHLTQLAKLAKQQD